MDTFLFYSNHFQVVANDETGEVVIHVLRSIPGVEEIPDGETSVESNTIESEHVATIITNLETTKGLSDALDYAIKAVEGELAEK